MLLHPTLIVVSGPPGAGKTTLAHLIARTMGCPVISRDEIKEGMVQAAPDFVASQVDELSTRTLPVFFAALELLLRAGVTTVAEAAFQDRLWRPGLEPLQELASIRVVYCTVPPEVAIARSLQRSEQNPLRRAHADPRPQDAPERIRQHRAFDRVSVAAPWIEVDTADGYKPAFQQILTFVGAPGG